MKRESWGRAGRVLRRLARMLAAIVFGLYLVFRFAEPDVLFAGGDPTLSRTPADLEWAYDDITLPVKDGVTRGWYMPLEDARGVVFYCHGGGGNIATRLDEYRQFRSLGFSVLTFDYAAYGESSGTPSEQRIYADAMAMWRYLTKDKGIAPEKVVIWGRSFGGGAACEVASRVKPGAVVLESTYTSVPDAAYSDYPWFPSKLFTRYSFNNVGKVKSFSAPLLVVHSLDDQIFPYRHGQALFDAAHEPKTMLTVHGAHGAVYDRAAYDKQVKAFLDGVFPPTAS